MSDRQKIEEQAHLISALKAEIAALKTENDRLRAALLHVFDDHLSPMRPEDCRQTRAALGRES